MKTTTVYRDTTYPMVEKHMDKNRAKYERNVKNFIKVRIEDMNAIAPYKNITHTESEKKKFWVETGFSEKDFKEYIHSTYYGNKSIKPVSAKDPFTICMMNIIRYYYKKKKPKELKLAMLHLSFSGKFYSSVHYNSFRIAPYPHVMDYVINNKLNYKYDIKKYGTLMKAIESLDETWLNTYKKRFDSWLDEDVVYLIDQLVDRLKSFMVNIAKAYYEAYRKEEYLAYSSDSLDEDDYRLADSTSLKIERIVSNSMTYLTTNKVSYSLCKISANNNVNVNQVKTLFEIILDNKDNLELIREYITILVSEFFIDKPLGKVNSAEFVVYGIKPRPNTNNKKIIRMKEIQQKLLEQDDDYLKRSKRVATKASYIKSFQTYLVYVIYNNNL